MKLQVLQIPTPQRFCYSYDGIYTDLELFSGSISSAEKSKPGYATYGEKRFME